MKTAAAAVLLCGCLFMQTPVMRFGAGKSPEEAQQQRVTQLTPPALVVSDRWAGEVSVAKIRVWADDDFRAQNVRWQSTFADELAYANEVLGPMFGIQLTAEYREWSRHAPGST